MAKYDEWISLSWYCPNCGRLVSGYVNSGSTIKVKCANCHLTMSRKIVSRRHDTIDLYAPEGQERVV